LDSEDDSDDHGQARIEFLKNRLREQGFDPDQMLSDSSATSEVQEPNTGGYLISINIRI
jgi:hypothetical protein